MPRTAARKDGNHDQVCGECRDAGAVIVETYQLGDGIPDACVGMVDLHTGIFTWLWVEIKSKSGKLTAKEQAFRDGLPDDAPWLIARHADDVLDWFGRL